MANFFQMAQKATQLKSRLKEVQDRVSCLEVEGLAPGVTCRMNGRFALTALDIDEACFTGNKKECTRLILAAINDGRNKAEQLMAEETKKMMEDLGLPSNFDLPL